LEDEKSSLQSQLVSETENSAALLIQITTLNTIEETLRVQVASLEQEKADIISQAEVAVVNLQSQIDSLVSERDGLQCCTQSLNEMRETFVAGHGEYQLQSEPGFCVRSTDNEYDLSNLTEMLTTSDSVYECSIACNDIETCVAFDYGPNG
jgi:hypothetical protein